MLLSKSRTILAAFALLGTLLVAENVQAQAKVNQAVAMAQQTGRPILLIATATWCGPCQELKQRFANEAALQPLLSEYVCVNLDIEADERDFQAWNSQFPTNSEGIPKVYIVTAQGTELYNGGAYMGDGLNRLLSESLATAKQQTAAMEAQQLAEMEAAQAAEGAQEGGVEAEPASPFAAQVQNDQAASPFAAQVDNEQAASPFAPLQEAEEEEPAAPAVTERRPVRDTAPEDDTEMSQAQLNRRLDGYLRMANTFAESRPEKSREYVEKIIELAPESPQATQAQSLLGTLD